MYDNDFAMNLNAATKHMMETKEYDQACKKILEYKLVLARILKATTDEFRELPYDEIEKWIADISTDEALDSDMPKAVTIDTESTSFTDGVRRFDVKFVVRDPKDNRDVVLIVNVEAQDTFGSSENVHKRAEYYVSRMISDQYNKTFRNSDFKSIKKVYSIWICTDPSKNYRNTVTEFPRTVRKIIGDLSVEENIYNVSSYIIVGLNHDLNSKNEFIRFLDTLFSASADYETKKRILSEEYNIQMESTDFGKDVASMCDLGYGVLKEGLKTGREEGKIEGTLSTLAGLVKDGILTVDEAAKRANMTSAEFVAKTGIKE